MHWITLCALLLVVVGKSSVLKHLSENTLHAYSEAVSRQLSEAIKIKLVQQISMISNQTLSKYLMEDLFEDEDNKRVLTSIDPASAREIFGIFHLKPPVCDKDQNGIIEGRELKCFNKIWKYYIPGDQNW